MPDSAAEFFLVDPLDGTKEFVDGGNDFTVNIGLIRDGVPVVGSCSPRRPARSTPGSPATGAWTGEVAGGRVVERAGRSTSGAGGRPIDVVASNRTGRPRPTPISPATRSASWSPPARR